MSTKSLYLYLYNDRQSWRSNLVTFFKMHHKLKKSVLKDEDPDYNPSDISDKSKNPMNFKQISFNITIRFDQLFENLEEKKINADWSDEVATAIYDETKILCVYNFKNNWVTNDVFKFNGFCTDVVCNSCISGESEPLTEDNIISNLVAFFKIHHKLKKSVLKDEDPDYNASDISDKSKNSMNFKQISFNITIRFDQLIENLEEKKINADWSDEVAMAIYDKTKIPCVYNFKNKWSNEEISDKANFYFCSEFTTNFQNLCYTFPTWTNCMRKHFLSTNQIGTSTRSEANFKDAKNRVSRPILAQKYMLKDKKRIKALTNFAFSGLPKNLDSEMLTVNILDNTKNDLISFIENIFKNALSTCESNEEISDKANFYFCSEFTTNFQNLCYTFPTWTNCMRKHFLSPNQIGTSTRSEANFKDVKKRVPRPILVQKYMLKDKKRIKALTNFAFSRLPKNLDSEMLTVNVQEELNLDLESLRIPETIHSNEEISDKANFYFCSEFTTNFQNLCYTFPTWTNCMRKHFLSTNQIGTSTRSEANFKDAKNRVSRPILAQKYMLKDKKRIKALTNFAFSGLPKNLDSEMLTVNSSKSHNSILHIENMEVQLIDTTENHSKNEFNSPAIRIVSFEGDPDYEKENCIVHYKTYVLSPSKQWILFNDLNENIQILKETPVDKIALIMYTKTVATADHN
ncbi:hypothetical protein TSAR_016744 [Trichomalopsis sarcophagae]|uniref:Uncharacterized protein n=1 Tax=Trichomalopsis sarcophagae TaxID=543379 RepID=A0A232FCA9_9HYME|nr:hypothetical protein TSAR_016744 [Trichomalopsis sarcophagae]